VELSKKYLFVRAVPKGLKHSAWTTGKALASTPTLPPLEAMSASPPTSSDMLLTQFQLPILSVRALATLTEAGVDNLESFPLRIEHRKLRAPETTHRIVNIVGVVKCLDRKRAKIQTFDDGEISWLERYRILDRDVFPKAKKAPRVFRLGEFRHHVLVHESVKDAFEKAGLTGAAFIAPEKFG
jgi:hypothetical protein